MFEPRYFIFVWTYDTCLYLYHESYVFASYFLKSKDLSDAFVNGTQDPFLSLTLSTQGVNHYSISYVTLSNTIVYIQLLVLLSRLAVQDHNI